MAAPAPSSSSTGSDFGFIWVIVGMIAMLWLLGYGLYQYAPGTTGTTTPENIIRVPRDLPIETIARSSDGGTPEQAELAVWDETSMEEFKVKAPNVPQFYLNYETEMAIGIFMGSRSTGGYSVTIDDIKETQAKITVYGTHHYPAKSCPVTEALTEPYHLIKTTNIAKEIHFELRSLKTDCE